LKTATYAVMFTDIEGFTERTSRQTRTENERMLRLHDGLLLPVIDALGGRRVKTIGDAYLVVFPSVQQALRCGAAMQDRLWEYNREVPDLDRIGVRVAINAGEVRLSATDVFGEAVNVASRVEALAVAGEVWFTEAIKLLTDAALPPHDDLGAHTLKGVPEPVHLYRLRPEARGMPFAGEVLFKLGLPPAAPSRLAAWRPPLRSRLRDVRLAIGAALLVLAVVATTLLWHERPLGQLERLTSLVEEGRLDEARQGLAAWRLSGADPAQIACLEGIIAQASGDDPLAIAGYERCAERNPELATTFAGPRLVQLLDREPCDVQVGAARVLGNLPGARAEVALGRVSARWPTEDGRCRAGDEARAALERLHLQR
jgi:class 3 adenylate cyclase